MLWRIKSKI